MEREELDRVVGVLAGIVAPERRLQEREESVDGSGAALGLEVLAPQPHQRVGVLAPFLGQILGVGGEVGEVLVEGSGWCGAGRGAQMVQRDLHFRPFEESTATAHAEGDALARERLLEQRRLRVHPIEDRHPRPPQVGALGGAQRARDAARLLLRGGVLGEVGEGTVSLLGVDGGAASTGWAEHRAGGGDHLRGRSVVAAEPDHADVGKLLGREPPREAVEVGRIGTGEAVDRLIRITDHTEVAAVAQPRAQQPELRGAGVLELVDEEVTEPPALSGGEFVVALQHVGAARDQIVEVDEPALALLPFVTAVDRRHLGRRPRRGAAGGGDRVLVTVGLHEPGLGPLDLRRDLGCGQRGLPPAGREERDEDTDLALEQRGHGAALLFAPAPQLRERNGVEGAGGDGLAHAESGEAGPEFSGRLAGEGDGQHVRGIDHLFARLPRDATGEDAGLARPRAGEDRQRRGATGDRIALRRVQTLEERVHRGTVPPGYDSHTEARTQRLTCPEKAEGPE